jgi:hypothetical protein
VDAAVKGSAERERPLELEPVLDPASVDDAACRPAVPCVTGVVVGAGSWPARADGRNVGDGDGPAAGSELPLAAGGGAPATSDRNISEPSVRDGVPVSDVVAGAGVVPPGVVVTAGDASVVSGAGARTAAAPAWGSVAGADWLPCSAPGATTSTAACAANRVDASAVD